MMDARPWWSLRARPCLARLIRSAGILVILLAADPIYAMERTVKDSETLRAAMEAAQPGDVVVLESGAYALTRKIAIERAGRADEPITVRSARLGDATIFVESQEGFHIRAPHWHFENLLFEGVCADDSFCEHALHITGRADGTRVRGCEFKNFNAHIKGNGEPLNSDNSYVHPDDVLIEGNEFYNERPRETANPVTPIDVVGGKDWILRANYIHDHAKAGGNQVSYAAFLKGNAKRGLIERNLVVCESMHEGHVRLGLSLGGGGSGPPEICEDGTCTPEHDQGVIRNNIILNCPADVGIYVNKAKDSYVLHNTLIGTTGVDIRFAESTVVVQGNLLDGRVRARDGAELSEVSNLQDVASASWAMWFEDVAKGDLRVIDGSAFVDQAPTDERIFDDYCGRLRTDGRNDIGALEQGGDVCDTTQTYPVRAGASDAGHEGDAGIVDMPDDPNREADMGVQNVGFGDTQTSGFSVLDTGDEGCTCRVGPRLGRGGSVLWICIALIGWVGLRRRRAGCLWNGL